MLTITSPRVARALAAGRLRSQRRAAWGSFSQRTIDRRYCGLPFVGGADWYARKVQLAGGVPSQLVWQPFGAAQVRQSVAICHFCQSAIDEATSRCACFAPAAAPVSARARAAATRLWGFHSYRIRRERQEGCGPVFRLAPGRPWPTYPQQVALASQQAAHRQQRHA